MIADRYQLSPHLILLEPRELTAAIEANPFDHATCEPTTLHFFFLFEKPGRANFDRLDQLKATTEDFKLIGKVFYLYTPHRFAGSKLAANVEKHLRVRATARNYKTVAKIRTMLTEN